MKKLIALTLTCLMLATLFVGCGSKDEGGDSGGDTIKLGWMGAISSGYAMLIDESSDVLQDLKNLVNVTGMSLTDAERLAIIDNAYRSLMNYRNLVRYYTNT